MSAVPSVDVRALFGKDSVERAATDRAFLAAAEDVGFIRVRGLPADVEVTSRRRAALKRIFALSAEQLRPLWRQKFDPQQPNVYRGWFPLQQGHPTYKEGIDMGPDVAHGGAAVSADPLCEATPLPPETALPGWRGEVSDHYLGMEKVGRALMQCLARGLALPESAFDTLFAGGVSTLRLLRYPPRPAHDANQLAGAAHVDSGLLTLLLQDGVGGLQVKNQAGAFEDVPVEEGVLVVNFGRLLELWTQGRIRATEHRVLAGPAERHSFPFFYEPRVDALIQPLSPSSSRFEPFLYGDFVWRTATQFIEFKGLEALRPPRGPVPVFD